MCGIVLAFLLIQWCIDDCVLVLQQPQTGALDWKIVTVIPQANLEGTFSSLNVTSALILAMVVILWGFQVFLMLQVVPLVHHAMKYKFNKFRHGVLTSTAFIENGKRCWQGGIPPVETGDLAVFLPPPPQLPRAFETLLCLVAVSA